MGAWGDKPFENDSALDWLADLEAEGVTAIRSILSDVAETEKDEYLEVDDGAAAIAAAEIVAAALGHGRDRLSKPAAKWLDANPGAIVDRDARKSRRAVKRVFATGSELRSLWDESGSDTPWHEGVRVLLTKLGEDPGAVASPAKPTAKKKAAAPQFDQLKQALLTFLSARGLVPDARQRKRIDASRDGEEIRSWLSRAVAAPSVAAVLDGE